MITNKKIKELNNLRDKSKARKELGRYIVEGFKMYSEAPENELLEVYCTKAFYEEHKEELKAHKCPVEIVEDNVFNKLSDTKTPQGIMCVLSQKKYAAKDIIGKDNALYMVLEDIQDPGNLGTIFRTGEGAGVSGIIMTKGCVDIYNPKTIRSTMGSIYRVPFTYVEDTKETIKELKEAGVKVYAAHLKGEHYYDEEKYEKCAFLIGNEGNGLKDETAALADTYIKIPMAGEVESLNAAVASSILMYEYNRQNGLAR